MSHQSKDRAIIQTDREIQAMRKRLERALKRGLPRRKDRDAAKAFAAVVPLTDAQRSVALKLKQEMRGGR